MMTRLGARFTLLLAIVATIGCDRVTKHVAATALAGEPRQSFWADTVRLEYVENAGGFLSLGTNLAAPVRTAVFTVGTAILLLALLGVSLRSRWHGWTVFGVSLIFAGGASNWVDRAVHGNVVDFINIGIGPLRTGIFNVADVAIMLGSGIVLLAELRRGRARAS